MAQEIERKFLVSGSGWRDAAESSRMFRQAYLARTGAASVRVRIVDEAEAFLTIKSATPGRARAEFEYPIPVADARALLALRTGRVIEKRRYRVRAGASSWEVDVFAGDYAGLVIAEIELPAIEAPFDRPAWLGAEVTDDPRYYSADLATRDSEGGP